MRTAHLLTAGVAVLVVASTRPCRAVDWAKFDDPHAIVLTDPLAKSIGALAAPDKAAAVQRLHESLKSQDVEIRRRAALTLGHLGDKDGVPAMIADMSQATGRDRDNVVVALRILKDDRAIPALREALKDKSPYVRGIALAALGEMKATKAYDDIVALTTDKEENGGGKNAGPLNCFRTYPAEMACYALGALGDKRAVPVLIERLTDKDLQESARQALEALTDQKLGNDAEKWKSWWKNQSH
jgi:HEAT repeat protein